MSKKKFGTKDSSKIIESKGLMLNTIRHITYQDPEVFQMIKNDYNDIDKSSRALQKAYTSLICAILTHERIYFALTRKNMLTLMLTDPNIPKELRSGFSPNEWPRLKAKFYNECCLLKLIYQGEKRMASAYEVIHPEILKYLEPKVDREKQLQETLAFCQKKS